MTPRSLTPGQRRTLWAAAIGSAILFFVLALACRARLLVALDTAAGALIQSARHATYALLAPPVKLLGALGSGWVLAPIALVGYLALSARCRRLSTSLLLAVAPAPAALLLAKVLVGRPRPHLTAYGFPSGHVFGATIFFGLVVYVAWVVAARPGWARVAAVAGALAVAAVAGARLYENLHWVSDVLGGVAGGVAYVFGAVLVIDRRLVRADAALVRAPASPAQPESIPGGHGGARAARDDGRKGGEASEG